MTTSLLLGGLEMVGDTVNPEYRLGEDPDYGTLTPDTVTLSSLLSDGDFISGERTGNKAWSLVIQVFSPVTASRLDLSTRIDSLLAALYQDTFPVVWTPSSGVSSNFTAYRATCDVAKSIKMNDQLVTQVTVSFQTGPFARSSAPQTVSVPAAGSTAQLQVDGMNSGTFTGGSTATLSTSTKYEGAGSMTASLSGSGGTYNMLARGRAITSVNLSSYASMSVRVQCPSFTALGAAQLYLVLASSGGTATYGSALVNNIPAGSTTWNLCTWNLTPSSTTGTFDPTAVTSWLIYGAFSTSTGPSSITVYFDDLRAYPPGSVGSADAQGGVLVIPVGGSARTPVALEIDRAGSAFTSAVLHSPPIDQDPDVAIHLSLTAGAVTVPAANMKYNDSFSLLGILTTSATGARTATVTVTQKISATTISTKSWTQALTGTQTVVDLTPPDGPLTLPLVAQPAENTNGSITFSVASTGDTWADLDLLSTSGQTILATGLGSAMTCEALYVDQPLPGIGLGSIYQAPAAARTSAYSAAAQCLVSGGPILFEPGNNKLLVVSAAGALGATASFYEQWLDEALA